MPDHYDKKSSGPGDEKKKKSEYTTQNGRLVKKEYIRKSPSDLGANDASTGFGKESTSVDLPSKDKLQEAKPVQYGMKKEINPIMRYNKEIKPLPGNPNYGKTTPKKK